jgi:hypothetical protein
MNNENIFHDSIEYIQRKIKDILSNVSQEDIINII